MKIKLDDNKGIWDLVLSAPTVYCGDGVYEVSDFTLKVLKRRGIKYTEVRESGSLQCL